MVDGTAESGTEKDARAASSDERPVRVPDILPADSNGAVAVGPTGGRIPGGYLTRDRILAVSDMSNVDVYVPEWDGVVRLRMLTSRERDAFESSLERDGKDGKTEKNYANLRARLIRMCAVNPDGSAMFTEEDESWLGDKSSAACDLLYTAAARHSRLGKADVDAILKNSGGAR